MSAPVELLARLGPGAAVATNLRCPNWNCRHEPTIAGSAEVVNEYGVRDVRPRYCERCGVALRVVEFVDLETWDAERPAGHRTP